MSEYTLTLGDCREVMAAMQPESVDAIVTDDPYELGFMGKRWDASGISYDPATWKAALRVLRPGGRLLAFGGTRTWHRIWCAIEDAGFTVEDTVAWLYGSGFPKHKSKLKPAHEPICVARKGPASPLNIEACRIACTDKAPFPVGHSRGFGGTYAGDAYSVAQVRGDDASPSGRWPANVVLDEEAAAMLDAQTEGAIHSAGVARSGSDNPRPASPGHIPIGPVRDTGDMHRFGDSGGASRFFYTAKAARSEREYGLEGIDKRPGGSNAKGFTDDVARGLDRNRPVRNAHPTVKPVDLMRWLCRLVTPPSGLILDPFMGSGTTGVAATLEGFRFVGIEIDPEYMEIARLRIGNAQPSLFGQEPAA